MPKSLNGKKLSKKEHQIWRSAYQETGNGAIATEAVKKYRKKKKSKR